jgi:hypothetical protein
MSRDETYVTEEGRLDVLTLPSPQDQWLWALCCAHGLGELNFWGSFEITLDELAQAMEHAGIEGVLKSMH